VIVLRADRSPGETPEHRDLADVRQSVRNRSLEELFRRISERRVGGEVRLEAFQRLEESLRPRVPVERG